MNTIDAAPQRLYLMQLSAASVPVAPGRSLDMVCVCYLVEMGDGRRVLIDTGLPDGAPLMGLPPAEGSQNVIEALADLHLRPADIDVLICTHFDVDHAGYHDALPQAECIVQRRHYEQARGGDARYAAVRQHWDHPALHYRLVDGDTELLPGLTLIETSGHAPAHQSVLVRLPHSGPVLLAIDAVIMARLFTPDRQAWPMDDDEAALRASTQKLLDVAAREGVSLVVFGHDGAQWRTLKRAPEYYD